MGFLCLVFILNVGDVGGFIVMVWLLVFSVIGLFVLSLFVMVWRYDVILVWVCWFLDLNSIFLGMEWRLFV